jgi:hypothetical protein
MHGSSENDLCDRLTGCVGQRVSIWIYLSVERADAALKLSFAVFTCAEGTGLVLP